VQEESSHKKPRKCASQSHDEAVDVEVDIVDITGRNTDSHALYFNGN